MEDKRLALRQKELAEDLKYYSNNNKPLRERDVITKFLDLLGISHSKTDLISPKQESKIDVIYKEANFQVKEITDEDMQRGRWYKDNFNKAKNADSFEESFAVGKATNVPRPMSAYELIIARMINLTESKRYSDDDMRCIDLIFEITRTRTSFLKESDILLKDFENQLWRSVSYLHCGIAVVVFASNTAPNFLQSVRVGI